MPCGTCPKLVHADVWVPMGEPKEAAAKQVALQCAYRVDLDPTTINGDLSPTLMHTIKAVLVATLA